MLLISHFCSFFGKWFRQQFLINKYGETKESLIKRVLKNENNSLFVPQLTHYFLTKYLLCSLDEGDVAVACGNFENSKVYGKYGSTYVHCHVDLRCSVDS